MKTGTSSSAAATTVRINRRRSSRRYGDKKSMPVSPPRVISCSVV